MTTAELRSERAREYEVEYSQDTQGLDEFAAEPGTEGLLTVATDERVADVPTHEPDTSPNIPDRSLFTAHVPAPAARSRRWPLFIPLAIGAVAVSAWYGLTTRDVGLPLLPAAPAWWASAEPHVAIPIPQIPATPVSPRVAAPDTPVPPVPSETSDAPLTRVAAPTASPVSAGPARTAVDETLAAVSRSYRALDAASLTRVWPGADVAALSQRFSTLKYQSLSFDGCDVRPVGADQVVANCHVAVASAANSGDPSLQRRRESWSIVLNRSRDRYVIGSVVAR